MSRAERKLTAIEFFSGIGAFAEAAAAVEPLAVTAAFDQSEDANRVYQLNHNAAPCRRNLDSISLPDLPAADIWWLSPPCQPFSRRGAGLGLHDPRARCFTNLIALAAARAPGVVFLENVEGFAESDAEKLMFSTLQTAGYQLRALNLCPTMFGVPMRRPRRFVVALLPGWLDSARAGLATESESRGADATASQASGFMPVALRSFLDDRHDPSTELDAEIIQRYGGSFSILDPDDPDARAICFTSGYGRSVRAAGSYLRLPGGGLRRFSPGEIVRLLGFSSGFRFPPDMPIRTRWRLAGNSVDVRCITHLLRLSGIAGG